MSLERETLTRPAIYLIQRLRSKSTDLSLSNKRKVIVTHPQGRRRTQNDQNKFFRTDFDRSFIF